MNDAEEAVMRTLRHEMVPLKVAEIAAWTDVSAATVRRALARLATSGAVAKNAGGYWAFVREPDL